jgi:hypothetical protein
MQFPPPPSLVLQVVFPKILMFAMDADVFPAASIRNRSERRLRNNEITETTRGRRFASPLVGLTSMASQASQDRQRASQDRQSITRSFDLPGKASSARPVQPRGHLTVRSESRRIEFYH